MAGASGRYVFNCRLRAKREIGFEVRKLGGCGIRSGNRWNGWRWRSLGRGRRRRAELLLPIRAIAFQSALNSLHNRFTNCAGFAKTDLAFGRMHIDVNAAGIDKMRATVDEKLQGTLEKRLGESFKLVSDRLEQVHQGLGAMRQLASDVGGLQRVLTNVKTRGGWSEWQLGVLLDEMLTPEQFSKNMKMRDETDERVEFAIKIARR